ncbi:U3 small nucleolar RNA-associated protein 11 [Biomphalaria pfeifferi]|uniref:U3 small nucleolar RNA-associated protein 11 n=1 Tax=Biomphalaria pfeifferi TaxID=112525 RepID=A0AAD8AT75_BIOPF|nr:U3 small nucleolar RNA-associated protein 11 [Biomphalaria pfeifferi]
MESLKSGQFPTETEQWQAVMEAKDATYKETTRRIDSQRTDKQLLLTNWKQNFILFDTSADKKCLQQETKNVRSSIVSFV